MTDLIEEFYEETKHLYPNLSINIGLSVIVLLALLNK